MWCQSRLCLGHLWHIRPSNSYTVAYAKHGKLFATVLEIIAVSFGEEFDVFAFPAGTLCMCARFRDNLLPPDPHTVPRWRKRAKELNHSPRFSRHYSVALSFSFPAIAQDLSRWIFPIQSSRVYLGRWLTFQARDL